VLPHFLHDLQPAPSLELGEDVRHVASPSIQTPRPRPSRNWSRTRRSIASSAVRPTTSSAALSMREE
jgi:hypothetical protein